MQLNGTVVQDLLSCSESSRKLLAMFSMNVRDAMQSGELLLYNTYICTTVPWYMKEMLKHIRGEMRVFLHISPDLTNAGATI